MYSSAGSKVEYHQRLLQKTEKVLQGTDFKYQHPFMLVRTGSSSSATARRTGSLPKHQQQQPALQRTNTLGSSNADAPTKAGILKNPRAMAGLSKKQ